MADATQGGADQHIRLKKQPERPSLPDALMVADLLRKPAAAKWGGASARRRVVTPESEHGIVSIMGPDGLYYAYTVDAFGVVSAGQNWDRLASAVHRRALKLVDAKGVFILLFSGDALFCRSEIFEESCLLIIFSNDSRMPIQRGKFLVRSN